MFETIKILGVMLYSQLTVFLPDLIRNKEPEFLSENSDYAFYPIYFFLFQGFLYKILPGPKMYGSRTPEGNVPEYNNNGLLAWFTTILLQFFYTISLDMGDRKYIFEEIIPIFQKELNIYGIILAIFLYYNSFEVQNPNEPIVSGNPIKDIYKGVELHPKCIFGDIKILINSRFGMMLWGNIVLAAMMTKYNLAVFTSGIIQLVYITKFFAWEDGYVKTADITLDRAGYYLLWGCICYVPNFYTSPILYHYYNSEEISFSNCILTIIFGIWSIYINYSIDLERTHLRELKNKGEILLGHRFIPASYTTGDGEEHNTWLLASGYWGMARNINYLFELSATWTWTAPGYIPTSIWCYFYIIFLTVLLIHRTYRIDRKCEEKYGSAWIHYKILVPYKILPGIF